MSLIRKRCRKQIFTTPKQGEVIISNQSMQVTTDEQCGGLLYGYKDLQIIVNQNQVEHRSSIATGGEISPVTV